ncbi:hypothetical protein HN51_040819, partial [Arachis hypogaea]
MTQQHAIQDGEFSLENLLQNNGKNIPTSGLVSVKSSKMEELWSVTWAAANFSIAELPREDEIGSSSKEEESAQKGRNYDVAEKLRVLTRLQKWRWTSDKIASPPAKIQANARKHAKRLQLDGKRRGGKSHIGKWSSLIVS